MTGRAFGDLFTVFIVPLLCLIVATFLAIMFAQGWGLGTLGGEESGGTETHAPHGGY